MMGGGSDLDEAFRWLCGKANGGDFLILRARGDDDYNSYVNGLCKPNSVATLIVPHHAAASSTTAPPHSSSQIVRKSGGSNLLYVQIVLASEILSSALLP